MPSPRDLVEAYGFASRRQVLALLQGDDSVTVDARRRLNRSLLGGLLVCVGIVAAVGVAGFLSSGSSSSLPNQGVIVDSATGGSYVLVDNVLHPALNLASARLVAGAQSTTVSDGALRAVPRGLPVGIPGAPDSLPTKGSLLAGPWTACSVDAQATSARPQVTVTVGGPVPRPIAQGTSVTATGPDGRLWLLSGGLRFQVTPAAATLLQLDQTPTVRLLDQVLALVPQGPTIQLPVVPGAGGSPSVALPFTASVGDIVRSTLASGAVVRYVVLANGLAPVGPLAATLLGDESPGQRSLTVPAAQLAKAPSVRAEVVPSAWPTAFVPATPPRAGRPLCLTYSSALAATGGAWPVGISVPSAVPLPAHARAVATAGGGLPTAATGVAVAPGRGALVKATGSGGTDGSYVLVTDTGLRYPIASTDAVTRLGYTTSLATPAPLPFVTLLPSGPSLDPAAAATEFAGAAAAPAATASSSPPS